MKRSIFLVMIITILSKLVGFGREVVLSYVYGASAITDAYLISQTIPWVIFSFVSAGIATGFIPMLSRIDKEKGSLAANRYTSNLSNALIILSSIIVLTVLLFTNPIVKLFASGFSNETLTLAVRFTRISVFAIYFMALMHVFTAFLRFHNNYTVPALVAFPMNLLIMLALIISSKTNVYLIAIGSVIAAGSQIALLIPFVRRTGYRHKAVVDLTDEDLRMMLIVALPVIVGTSVNEINVLIDRTLASGIAVGGISALNYARRLNGFVQGLFVTSITTVMYPMISKMAAEGDVKGLKNAVSESILMISLLVFPTTVGAMVFSPEIVTLLFGRGAFNMEAVGMTASALFYYSLGMIAFGFRDILSRAFYALQDTRTPMYNATLGMLINIVLNFILAKYLGIGGLALATSLSAIVSTILMFVTLRRKIGVLGLRSISRSLIQIGLVSLVMGLMAWGSFFIFKHHFTDNLSLILSICFGVLVYATAVFFMKIPEVDRTLVVIRKKISVAVKKQNAYRD